MASTPPNPTLDEKVNVAQIDIESTSTSSPISELDDIPDPDVGKSDEERARLDAALVRKIDLWLIPWLSLVYLLCFLDRTNIGNAKVASMEKSLHMTGRDYNNALTIFFVSYALAEPVTNVLLKRFTPRVFFTTIILLWGTCMTCMGTVTSQSGLLAARFFLGLTEAGLFPGVNYYLSCWYKRSELGVRAALFFSAAALAGSFGGLLAAAITNMNGVAKYEGWRWIFILEGLLTVLVGAFCWPMINDFPDTARFLTKEEKLRTLRRMAADNQVHAATEKLNMKYVNQAIRDWKTWGYALCYMGCLMPLYSFSLFLPTILVGMKYEGTRAQLMSVPPYAAAAVMTVFIGWLADRTKWRGYCNIVISSIGCVGFAMLLGSTNPHVQYAGTFLGAMGIYPTVSNTLSWASNNVEGSYKRGVMVGTVVGWGNLNGVVSSNIYIASEKPHYRTGHATVLAFMVVCLLGGSILMHVGLRMENAAKKAGKKDHLIEGKTAAEIKELGDIVPDFKYVL